MTRRRMRVTPPDRSLRRVLRCASGVAAWLAGPISTLPAQAYDRRAAAAPDSSFVRFLSAEMTRQMTALDVPGAVVTVVRGERTIMNAAFGYASVWPRVAVQADSTTFRTASVAKVFTALAVLRVVESGRLSLQADIRSIVPGVPIRGLVDGPVTLHQLLTHTAGFDESLVGYLNPPGAAPEPLATHLVRAMPPRTRVAHDVPAYSNHGYALAGLVVERVTGIPFAAYVRDSLLLPLGMTATRFVLEPRDTVGIRLASEYRSSGERRVLRSSRPYPAGNLATTSADMSRFLTALSRALRGDSVPTISTTIARQLVGPVLRYHPQLPPMGYGLSGVPVHGRTVWMKGGSSPSHSAVLAVIPEWDVSVFIALNRQEPQLWDRVVPAFVAHLEGHERVKATPNATHPVADTRGLEGTYLWTRVPLGSPEKLLGLATQVSVSSTPSGLRISGFGEVAGSYVARDSLLFERADGRLIAFRRSSNAGASHVFTIVQGQPAALERVSVFRSTAVQLWAFVVAIVLSLVTGVLAVRPSRRGAPAPRWARILTVSLPCTVVATLAAAVALAGDADRLQHERTPLLQVALALATLAAVAAIAQIAGTVTLASRPGISRLARTFYWAGAIAGAVLLSLLISNNLVGRWTV